MAAAVLRRLRRVHIIALAILATVILAEGYTLDMMMRQQASDGRVINIAGRQRMLSQRITKAMLVLPGEFALGQGEKRVDELAKALNLWEKSHRGLRQGDAELGLPGNNSGDIDALFGALEEDYQSILSTAHQALALIAQTPAPQRQQLDLQPYLATVLSHEPRFLTLMDKIVFEYDRDSKVQTERLLKLQNLFALIELLTLAALAGFAFRPALRHIRTTIEQNETARRQLAAYGSELEQRVQARTQELAESNLRLQAEKEALEKSEARWSSVFEAALDAIVSIDEQGRVIAFNRSAEELFGYREEEIIGRNVTLLMPERFRNLHDRGMQRFISTGERRVMGQYVEVEGLRKDGEVRIIHLSLSEVPGSNRRSFIGMIRDMTRAKQAQEALLEANATLERERTALAGEVDTRTTELREANLALKQAMQCKDEFLATVSHELRTPLNAIQGFSQLLELEDACAQGEPKTYLDHIRQSSDQLLSLIDSVLDMSRYEMGQLTIERTPVAIPTLFDRASQLVRAAVESRHIQLSTDHTNGPAAILGDPVRLQQVLFLLLDNAVKFTPEGGRIELICEDDTAAQQVRFIVADNGIGIAQEDQQRIFEPFEQAESGVRRRYGGVGMGLTLADRLVRMHGGDITVHSQPGHGSRFTITLPIL